MIDFRESPSDSGRLNMYDFISKTYCSVWTIVYRHLHGNANKIQVGLSLRLMNPHLSINLSMNMYITLLPLN